jgi:anti-anti-sigma regulatory factor
MKAERVVEIKLSDIYERSITSRASISTLLDKHRDCTNCVFKFDFNQIIFMSRSSAQQLILERNDFLKKNNRFVFSNIDFQVNRIIELAANKLERKKLETIPLQFKSKEELSNFLLAF